MTLSSKPAGLSRPRLVALVLGGLLAASCGKSGGSETPPVEPPPEVNLPEFSYPARALLTEAAVAMTPQVPVATGTGSIDSWALEGTLPAGVVFDPATGTISGTPGELASPRSLKVTTTNTNGEYSQELSLSVSGTTRFAYSANAGDNTLSRLIANDGLGVLESEDYLLQTPGEANPQDIQADPRGRLVYALNSFALTPYLVDPTTGALTPGTIQGLGSGPHSLYVHPSGDYVYVSSEAGDRIRAFAVDGLTGTLSLIEQESTGSGPTDLAGDPNGRYVVVGHETGEELLSFLIDPLTGGLTLAGSTALLTVEMPDIEMGPLGDSLYVVLSQPFQGVLRCNVDTTTGIVTLDNTSEAGSTPRSMVVEPGHRFAYVLNAGSADISYYSIDDETGRLTKIGELPSTASTVSLRFSSDGTTAIAVDQGEREARLYDLELDGSLTMTSAVKLRQLPQALALVEGTAAVTRVTDVMYVVNSDGNDITVLTVDSATGMVSDGGLPATPTGVGPVDLALDPLGRFAFVSNATDQNVQVFAMQPNGDLTDNATPLNVAPASPGPLTVDPTGRFLYVALPTFNLLGMYTIQPDGSLSLLGTRPIMLAPEALVIDPAGLFLYVVQGGNRVTEFGSLRAFQIDAQSGVLTSVDPLIIATGNPKMLEFAFGGRRAYSPQWSADLGVAWDVEASANMVPVLSGSITQNEPVDIALTPDHRFAFIACNDSTAQGSLLTYDVDPANGRLYNATNDQSTWRNAVAAGLNPIAVEVSHDGRFVYALSEVSEQVRVFSIDQDTAFLTQIQGVARGLRPTVLRRRDALQ